jgi:hypothetical protein
MTGEATTGPVGRYELEIARDLTRHAAIVGPLVLLAAGLVRGVDGAVSALVALVLVAVNFLVAARLVGWAASKGLGAVYGAILGGYVLRLGALAAIVVGLERVSWIDLPVLVVTIAVTHLGLLVWEMRYVSLSLAAPGLKPSAPRRVEPILAGGGPSPDRAPWSKE